MSITKNDLILMAEQRRMLKTTIGAPLYTTLYGGGKLLARVGAVLSNRNEDGALVVMDVVHTSAGETRIWVVNIDKATGNVKDGGGCTWIGEGEISAYRFLANDFVEYLDNTVLRELEAKLQEAEKELEEAKTAVELKEISVMLLKEQIYK
jgi:hypothetical protein